MSDEPRPADEPAPAAAPEPIEEILAGTRTIAAAVARLDDLFRRRLLDDRTKQEAFDRLYEELEASREHRRTSDQRALLLEILGVIDQGEALLAADVAEREGLGLVLQLLREVIDRRRVSVMIELSDRFDPRVHEAVARIDADGPHEDATIAEVIRPGYRIGDAVLRPARVVVRTAARDRDG